VRNPRVLLAIALLAIAAAIAGYWLSRSRSGIGDHVVVYYTKLDGTTEVPWKVSIRAQRTGESAAERARYAILYAATQAVVGPPAGVAALRFPPGTRVLSAGVDGSIATIDLSKEVEHLDDSGERAESGPFKSLVWTVTALPGIQAVMIHVQGQQIKTLPGGQFEIDEPLRRTDW
jgi:spore germination protein GerM